MIWLCSVEEEVDEVVVCCGVGVLLLLFKLTAPLENGFFELGKELWLSELELPTV